MKGPPRGSGNIILCYDIIMYQLTGMGKTHLLPGKRRTEGKKSKLWGLFLTFSKYKFRALPKS